MSLSPDLTAYLHRLGFSGPPPATFPTLQAVHRAHLEQIPYENLGIMLGRAPAIDADRTVARIAAVGRAGYCFHHNAALESLLRALGFAVTRRHGHVWTDEAPDRGDTLNHLVLVVDGVPTQGNPGGSWWVDVGLGDGFYDPLPLVDGAHRQGGFGYRLEDVGPDGWTFLHDATGSFTGMRASRLPMDLPGAHEHLSTSPDSPFVRFLVVQRRDATGCTTVRGCLLVRVDERGRSETELTTLAEWRDALVGGTGLALDDIPAADLESLWRRTRAAHEAWQAGLR